MNVATLERRVGQKAVTPKATEDAFPTLTASEIDRRRDRLAAGWYVITPDVARLILAHRNPVNRTMAPMKLHQLRHDMGAGKFVPNGESVIFSSEGNLLDGQHRLTISAETNTIILCCVAFGVAPEAQETMDQGKIRGCGNKLTLKGVPNGNNVAAVARMVIGYESSDGTGFGSAGRISETEILERVDYDPAITECTEWALSLRRSISGVVGTSYLAVALYIGRRAFGPKADAFLHTVATGEGYLPAGSPALSTRNRLIAERTKKGALSVEILLRGMLAYAEDRTLSRIQTDGRFPKLPVR